jgi:AraC-like DNA-binding protein
VSFYAEEMNLTPNYLSGLMKTYSGKTASEWIDEYVIIEAKTLLKFSGFNIQQVAYKLNFPNQSTFGKYFKRLTGMSPKSYVET